MKTKRIASVEFVRLIACFLVIFLHATEDILNRTGSVYFDTFINCNLFCSVTIFWFISGFYIFNNSYTKLINKTFKKIWLPTFIISIVCIIAYDFYLHMINGQEMLSVFEYLLAFISNAIKFRAFGPSCAHFWFIYTYCLVVLFFPVLKSFSDYLDKDIKRQKTFIVISLILIIVNEITLNEFASLENHGFGAVVMASIEVLLGHIFYENKETFLNKKNVLCVSILSLFVTNFIRTIVFILLAKNGLSTKVVSSWYSIFSIVSALSVIVFGMSIINDKKNSKFNELISYFGPLTLYAYMLHKIPIKILRKLGIEAFIINSNIVMKYILIFVYVFICFVLSLLIGYLANKVINIFKKNNNYLE